MRSPNQLPIIGITMGDPAGIGPEIILKAFQVPELLEICHPVVIGDSSLLAKLAQKLGHSVEFSKWQPGNLNTCLYANIPVLEVEHGVDFPSFGKPSFEGGKIALSAIYEGANLAQSGLIQALVTGPISKESISLAGCHSLGHTDLLAQLSGSNDYAMMLSTDKLSVVHTTVHMSLAEACQKITKDLVLRRIRLAAKAAKMLNLKESKVAVCGLNPHAGENGLLGMEEKKFIIPAIEEAQLEGLDVEGPFPADSIFCRALSGAFQMIVAMYHDQGHIPIKLLGLMDGVNVTLGLPFIRTSVDHGTAFGKAGKGTADAGSLVKAIKLAVHLYQSSPKVMKV